MTQGVFLSGQGMLYLLKCSARDQAVREIASQAASQPSLLGFLGSSLRHTKTEISLREPGRGVCVQGVLGSISLSGVTACRSMSSAFAQDSIGLLGGTEEGRCGSNPYELIRVGTLRGGNPGSFPSGTRG